MSGLLSKPYAASYALLPAAAVLCFIPHAAAVHLVGSKEVNLADPRSTFEKLPAESLARRLRCAHFNNLEQFAFILGGILACHSTGVPAATVDRSAVVWGVSRILYNIAF